MRRRRYTIDELSRETDVPSRSIRYYQTLGLLPSPHIEGRTGYYTHVHVDRLLLIQELRDEGLNLQAISWLLGGSAQVDSKELRRLKRAMFDGWMSAQPTEHTAAELLAALAQESLDDAAVKRARELGLVEPDEDPGTWRVLLPPVLAAGRELAQTGMQLPVDRALDVLEVMRRHARAVAEAYVDIFDETVLAPWDARGRPTDEWQSVRAAVDRMRPLAGEALLSVFQQVMAEAVAKRIGDMRPDDVHGPTRSPDDMSD